MIHLFDLGGEFWRNWFGTKKSAADAYQLTIEALTDYRAGSEALVVCCDSGSCFRSKLYPEYKANRPERPQEAYDCLRSVEQQVDDWKCPRVSALGYEADDVIATLAEQAWMYEVGIVSNDKDLYQLINDHTRLVTKTGLTSEAECVHKFGVKPSQMRDWLALAGDASDNIPGCENVGPGRARDLLKAFGSLDGIKAASQDELLAVRGVGAATVDSVLTWDPALAVSLVTLARDVPVKLEELISRPSAA